MELGLRVRIIWVLVRVVLDGELTISLLDVLGGCASIHAKDLIEVPAAKEKTVAGNQVSSKEQRER